MSDETHSTTNLPDSMAFTLEVKLSDVEFEQFLAVLGCHLCDGCKRTHSTLRYAVLISTPTIARGGHVHLCPDCAESLGSIIQKG